VRFPSDANFGGSPSWSPDGKQIAFDAHIGSYSKIYVASSDSKMPRLLTDGIIPVWSPDGRWIYYTSDRDGSQTVRRVPASGGESQQITSGGGFSVKISPDGKYVYYLKDRVNGELWRARADGGDERLLVRELRSRNFWVLPDGVYMLDPGVAQHSPINRGRARFYRFQTAKIEDLGFETEKPISHWGISLSPDGKWLYYAQADNIGITIMLLENLR
jgi:Tol biopolymer transport system component